MFFEMRKQAFDFLSQKSALDFWRASVGFVYLVFFNNFFFVFLRKHSFYIVYDFFLKSNIGKENPPKEDFRSIHFLMSNSPIGLPLAGAGVLQP